jgi:hypothetical protein
MVRRPAPHSCVCPSFPPSCVASAFCRCVILSPPDGQLRPGMGGFRSAINTHRQIPNFFGDHTRNQCLNEINAHVIFCGWSSCKNRTVPVMCCVER